MAEIPNQDASNAANQAACEMKNNYSLPKVAIMSACGGAFWGAVAYLFSHKENKKRNALVVGGILTGTGIVGAEVMKSMIKCK
jgi:hypothetical protein